MTTTNIAILGCGYVGTALARYWQKQADLTITATTTTPEKIANLEAITDRALLLKGNNAEGLKTLLQGQEIVVVSVGTRGKASYEETYLKTAQTLVSLLPQFPSLKQIIYTGSYAIYGDRKGQWVDETSPPSPANPNGEILVQTEQTLLNLATNHCKVCTLRLGGIYGEGRELAKIYAPAAGTTRPGTGEEASNWIHLDDIVGAIEFVRQHQLQEIYNLVDDSHLTTGELLKKVLHKSNLAPVTWDSSQPSRRPYNAKVSNKKIKTAGYQFIRPKIVF
ncbi:SDR family oxidoreductase [Lusitaniella coriacea LEGE 07157]|uniref:SDR family oxidoreductase n=1 Tax=Lusitaniella coriacea LEGE 07157 TaxID=945747 RepID=A0A8J7IXJ0_9CYAN|nr:SDR family oxidoreductase [Lusitaniella coriacea]MBE9118787.1 SDR family oxidoreductase [Lusitaniella coriacea LEGE 07157]